MQLDHWISVENPTKYFFKSILILSHIYICSVILSYLLALKFQRMEKLIELLILRCAIPFVRLNYMVR